MSRNCVATGAGMNYTPVHSMRDLEIVAHRDTGTGPENP
jgi:hypothetical protein